VPGATDSSSLSQQIWIATHHMHELYTNISGS